MNLELAAMSPCDTVLVAMHGSGVPPAPLEINSCTRNESVDMVRGEERP